MKDQDTELKIFLQKAGKPRDSFVTALEDKILKTNSSGTRTNFLSTVLMAFNVTKKQLAIGGGLTFLAVAAVFVTGGMYLWQKQQGDQFDSVLASIAQANLEARQKNSQSESKIASTMDAARLIYIDPKTRGYTYRKTVETYTWGQKSNSCIASFPYMTDVSNVEYVELFSKEDLLQPDYSLNVVKDKSNAVVSYELRRPKERYSYVGGSYAMKILNPTEMNILAMARENTADSSVSNDASTMPVDKPTDTQAPTDPKEIIKNYFGENAKVLGKETRNGKEVYKIEYSGDFYCSKPSSNPEVSSVEQVATDKQVTIAYFDAKTLLISEERFYLKTVADSNLLYARTVSVDQGKNTVAEKGGEFTFSLNVPVTTVDQSKDNYQGKYNAALRELLQKENIQIFSGMWTVSNQGIYAGNIRIIVDSEKHLYDQKFYPNTQQGKEQFAAMQQSQKPSTEKFQSLLTQTVSTTDSKVTAFNADVYALSEKEVIENIKTQRGEAKNYKESVGKVTINGTSIAATLFEDVNGIPARTEPVAPDQAISEGSQIYSVRQYIFSYSGKTYVIAFTVTSNDPMSAEQLTLKTLDAAQLNSVLTKMEQDAKNTPAVMY